MPKKSKVLLFLRSFVHGNAFEAENVGSPFLKSSAPTTISERLFSHNEIPLSDVVGLPRGWGKTYRGKAGQGVWFHVAVPTYYLGSSDRKFNKLIIERVFVIFAGDGCFISDVHIWDGRYSIVHQGNLHITGSHHISSDLSEPDLMHILYGSQIKSGNL